MNSQSSQTFSLSRPLSFTYDFSKNSVFDNPLNICCLTCPRDTLDPSLVEDDAFDTTISGNLISPLSSISNPRNIHLAGRSIVGPNVSLRGDIAPLKLGKYVLLNPNVILHPSHFTSISTSNSTTKSKEEDEAISASSIENTTLKSNIVSSNNISKTRPVPLSIQDYVYIGKESVIKCASIEKFVWIGQNCIIGQRCILSMCCMILPNSNIPDDTVIPSFKLYGGNPACCISSLPDSFDITMTHIMTAYYKICSKKVDVDGWPFKQSTS